MCPIGEWLIVQAHRGSASGFYLLAKDGASFFDFSKLKPQHKGQGRMVGFRLPDTRKGRNYFSLSLNSEGFTCLGAALGVGSSDELYASLDVKPGDCEKVETPGNQGLWKEAYVETLGATGKILASIPAAVETSRRKLYPLPHCHQNESDPSRVRSFIAMRQCTDPTQWDARTREELGALLEKCSGLSDQPAFQNALEELRKFEQKSLE